MEAQLLKTCFLHWKSEGESRHWWKIALKAVFDHSPSTNRWSQHLAHLVTCSLWQHLQQSVCGKNTISALKFYTLQLWTVKLRQASTGKQLDLPVDEASPVFYIYTCLIYHKVRISGKWINHCINTQKPAAILTSSVIECHEIITHIPWSICMQIFKPSLACFLGKCDVSGERAI